MKINEGDGGGFGRWGGIIPINPELRKGDQIWLRFSILWPAEFEFSATPWMKFIRFHTSKQDGKNGGYNDVYIQRIGDYSYTYRTIKEGHNRWEIYPVDSIPRDKWINFEVYIYVDDVPHSLYGDGVFRVWMDGKLIFDRTDIPTIPQGGKLDGIYIFTYWNNESPPSNSAFIDNLVIATGSSPPNTLGDGGYARIGD